MSSCPWCSLCSWLLNETVPVRDPPCRTLAQFRPLNVLRRRAASGYSQLLPGWCCSGDVYGSSRLLSGSFCSNDALEFIRPFSGTWVQPAVSHGIRPSPIWFNCLGLGQIVISTWRVEYLFGSTLITASLIEPLGIDHRRPSDWCACTCLIYWGSIGAHRRGPVRVLSGWCLWPVASSNPCADIDRWTSDLWLA